MMCRFSAALSLTFASTGSSDHVLTETAGLELPSGISTSISSATRFHVELVQRGYIPSVHQCRTIAFSVETLRFYNKLLAFGAISRQAFVKGLCGMHKVSSWNLLFTNLVSNNDSYADGVLHACQGQFQRCPRTL